MTTKEKFKEAITLINWWIIIAMFIILNIIMLFYTDLSKLKFNIVYVYLIIMMIINKYMDINFREKNKSKHTCNCKSCKCNPNIEENKIMSDLDKIDDVEYKP